MNGVSNRKRGPVALAKRQKSNIMDLEQHRQKRNQATVVPAKDESDRMQYMSGENNQRIVEDVGLVVTIPKSASCLAPRPGSSIPHDTVSNREVALYKTELAEVDTPSAVLAHQRPHPISTLVMSLKSHCRTLLD